MMGGDDQPGVVIAPETAEEANRIATALRAGGFSPTVDYAAMHDRQGRFPVLTPQAEVEQAKGFLKGLRASQAMAPMVSSIPAVAAQAALPPSAAKLLPTAGRAFALLTGLLVLGGGVMALTGMLQFLNSLRNH